MYTSHKPFTSPPPFLRTASHATCRLFLTALKWDISAVFGPFINPLFQYVHTQSEKCSRGQCFETARKKAVPSTLPPPKCHIQKNFLPRQDSAVTVNCSADTEERNGQYDCRQQTEEQELLGNCIASVPARSSWP